MELAKCGISPVTLKALTRKKIETAEEYIRILPTAVSDFSSYMSLPDAVKAGRDVVIKGILETFKQKPGLIYATVVDTATGLKVTTSWFGQNYIGSKLSSLLKRKVCVAGSFYYDTTYGYKCNHPFIFTSEESFTPSLCPRYGKITGVSDEMREMLYKNLIEYISEPLEFTTTSQCHIRPIKATYNSIHFPKDMDDYENGIRELNYRKMLYFAGNLKKTYPKAGSGYILRNTGLCDSYISSLPFALTADQKKTVDLVKEHVTSGKKLRLLVQGDVGCGKTAVAFCSLLLAVGSGMQGVITAPTQILAEQHYNEISEICNRLFDGSVKVCFLHQGLKAKEERECIKGIASGEYQIIVGTHSTFTEKYEYKNLGMIIIDEEHRFGVAQREALKEKAAENVHMISLSATPIPRSLATVMYGDACEIADIHTMPGNRLPILSAACDEDSKIFNHVYKQLLQGRQIYVVCPLVSNGEADEKKSVEEVYKRYSDVFGPKGYRVEFAHGKMKKAEIEEKLEAFRKNEAQILVATTVIEVGVNVPNASVIVIENAEMFGLAALHQLRGRVGRGKYQSYCIFKTTHLDNERIKVLLGTTDGFKIAMEDLRLRGTGNLLGIEQTGFSHFIELSTTYPTEYKKACEDAEWALKKGYENLLDVCW